jgi:hypothetical protein
VVALFATALACTAISVGCGGPPSIPAAQPSSRPALHFAISFKRSGGLKASVETLVVRPGLRAFATAPKGRREASKHFKMNAGSAEELRRELAEAGFAGLPSTPAEPCGDCYVYSIAYHGHEISFPASKVPESLLEVVDGLEEEVIHHLYRHVGYRRG